MITGLADGLVDILVRTDRTDGPGYPPPTEVDRLIAETVRDD
ncbi:hypothetical protein [Amycolatopsis sp. NBC_01480]|nr:hypothetical protein [Amycolatopsis sp. NBC_01480]